MPARLGCLRRLTRDLAIVETYGILALRSGKKWSEYDADTHRGTDRPLDVIEAIRRSTPSACRQPPAGHPPAPGQTTHTSGNIVLRAHER